MIESGSKVWCIHQKRGYTGNVVSLGHKAYMISIDVLSKTLAINEEFVFTDYDLMVKELATQGNDYYIEDKDKTDKTD